MMVRKISCSLWLIVFYCLQAGCGSGLPYAPRYPTDDKKFSAPLVEKRLGIPDDRPPLLVILPGDRINIELASSTTTLLEDVLVQASGTVHLPFAGDVEIKGLALREAEQKLQKEMRAYDSLVHVTVTVASLDGHKATVVGAVKNPGVVTLQPAARLVDVIMEAGGTIMNLVHGQLVSGSDLRSARLVRDGVRLPIDFEQAMSGDLKHNVFIHGGDQIYVPSERGLTINVMGQVERGTVVQWSPGVRLTEVLSVAGGVKTGADKRDVRIVRGPIDRTRVYQVSLLDIVDGKEHDVELYPGDVIWVSDHWVEDVTEVTTMLAPVAAIAMSIVTFTLLMNNLTN